MQEDENPRVGKEEKFKKDNDEVFIDIPLKKIIHSIV
jgi:hypothetical protein